MAIDLRQGLRLNQQLLMTPQLQQAIRLLQLSRLELEQFVSNELAENPCLEEGQLESAEESMQVEKERESTEEQIISQSMQDATNLVDSTKADKAEVDWESFAQQYQDNPIPSSANRSGDEEQPNYENMVSRASTLNEHIMKQLGELDFSAVELEIATIVVGNLDDKGYLMLSTEEICALNEGFDTDTVEGVIDTIQRLDPVGVGSRDLKECLLSQIRALGLRNGIVERIVENHLTELETKNFLAICKAMKLTLEVVIQNVQIIAELEPVPARQFGGEQTQYVVPDVYVFKLSGEWVVSLNEEGLPQLRVSDIYQKMVKKSPTSTGEEKNYITEKVKSAQWLIKSIQQRQRTIFRVTESIVKRQLEFFDKGVEFLRPMILKDIAEDIGMHESTISRVTNNKYVHTPRGIFELKYFFNSSVARSDGLDVASESVKRMIAEIIKIEDTKRPLSDQTIVEMLDEKGIQLARRTVAKYREQLNILPSSKRKKYF